MAVIDRTNWAQVQREFRQAEEEFLRKAVVFMAKVGERAVTFAREKRGGRKYQDQSGNLVHSIGYLVIQNGVVKVDAYGNVEAQYQAAQSASRQYAYQVAKDHPKGTVLIWSAGMYYAKYVEAKGFDVLAGSAADIESSAQSLVHEFEQYLLSA